MKQKMWKLPRCPYCGRKLSFWEAWVMRTQGEFTCPKCVSPSNITFHQSIYGWAFFACLLGAGLLLVSLFLPKEPTLFGTALVLLPFLGFTLLAPNLMRLERFALPQKAARPNGNQRAVYHTRSPAPQGQHANTMVIPALKGTGAHPTSKKPPSPAAQSSTRPRQPGAQGQRPPLTYEQRRRIEQQRRQQSTQGAAAKQGGNPGFVPPPKKSAAQPKPSVPPIDRDFVPPYARREEQANPKKPEGRSPRDEDIQDILNEFTDRYH